VSSIYLLYGRFVKIPYLQHSIESAYEGLIPQGSFPSYFIHLEIDPSKIYVNIHPSKTEIKFLNEESNLCRTKSRCAQVNRTILPFGDYQFR
jgi:DNA mismatch repair protein MutL